MKPWLWIPASMAHELAPYALKVMSLFQPEDIPQWKTFKWRGLVFNNPLGLAGGVDKNGENVSDWWKFGAGFVEVGTVTPLPQKPNPGKIFDRDFGTKAIWNKMGFPNYGGQEVLANLLQLQNRSTPLFVNIGKNRQTSNENSAFDYIELMTLFREQADAFVINISSPNTKDLRRLLEPDQLEPFLHKLIEHNKNSIHRPLLLKLSPDFDAQMFEQVILIVVKMKIDGFVLTNTTLERPSGFSFPKEGGLSGFPLKNRSQECLKQLVQILGVHKKDFLIVSAGGVTEVSDVFERLKLGADLVEVYSTLIFNGPCFFRKVAQTAVKEFHGRQN